MERGDAKESTYKVRPSVKRFSVSSLTCYIMSRYLGLSFLIILGTWKAYERYRGVVRKVAELENSNRQALAERDETKSSLEKKAAELITTQERLSEIDTRLHALLKQHDQVVESNRILTIRLQSAQHEAKSLQAQLDQVNGTLTLKHKALRDSDAELRKLDPFSNRTDDISEAEALDVLQSLNQEMHNTAALIADTFEFSSDGLRADMTSDAMIGACEHAGDMVGNRLLELLLRSKHNEDPILVQLSLQACLGVYALWIVSSWHFELHGEESFLEKIYDSMRRRETQIVSARWRALTHRHIQTALQPPSEFVVHLVEDIANILTLAGCIGDTAHLRDAISTRFSAELNIILERALRVKKVIRISVRSCDLDAVSVAPDIEFNEATMGDEFEASYPRNGEMDHVLCGTDLGLERSIKVDEETFERRTLRKPKVVRERAILEMLADRRS